MLRNTLEHSDPVGATIFYATRYQPKISLFLPTLQANALAQMSSIPETVIHVSSRSSTPSPTRLECDESFMEPIEDMVDRSIFAIHNSSIWLKEQWLHCMNTIRKLRREVHSKELTMHRLEDRVILLEKELRLERNVLKIYERAVKRMKSMVIDKGVAKESDEECHICARPFTDLQLITQIPSVELGCCRKTICLQCVLRYAHVQSSARPPCPFCKQIFC